MAPLRTRAGRLALAGLAALSLTVAACAPARLRALPTRAATLARPAASPTATPPPATATPTPTRARPSPTPPPASPSPLIAAPPSATPFSPLAPLALVPGGEFIMGSAAGSDSLAEAWERPAHPVTLTSFWLETVEVSNARYAVCQAAGVCSPPQAAGSRTRAAYYGSAQFANYPVVYVTHAQAAGYCAWAGGRLPTEAEWEYAARYPDGRRYPWGAGLDPGRGNFARPAGSDTEPVDAFPSGASALGLLNLAGNVWEWVADWYDPAYYAVAPRQAPAGPAAGTERSVRGGAYATDGQYVRTANRLGRDPGRGYDNLGFRCAADQPPAHAPLHPTPQP